VAQSAYAPLQRLTLDVFTDETALSARQKAHIVQARDMLAIELPYDLGVVFEKRGNTFIVELRQNQPNRNRFPGFRVTPLVHEAHAASSDDALD
jgi:hypothetical protein